MADDHQMPPRRQRFRAALEALVQKELEGNDWDLDEILSELNLEAVMLAHSFDPLDYPRHAYASQVEWVINEPTKEDLETAEAELAAQDASAPPVQPQRNTDPKPN